MPDPILEHIVRVTSPKLHNNPIIQERFLFLFGRWRHWGLRRLSKFPPQASDRRWWSQDSTPGCATLESSGISTMPPQRWCPAHPVSRGQLRHEWENTLYSKICTNVGHSYLKNSAFTHWVLAENRVLFYKVQLVMPYGEGEWEKKLLALPSSHLHFIKCWEGK